MENLHGLTIISILLLLKIFNVSTQTLSSDESAQTWDDLPTPPTDIYRGIFIMDLLEHYIPVNGIHQVIKVNEESINIFRDAEKAKIDYGEISNQITQKFTNLITSRQKALKNLQEGVQQVFDDSIFKFPNGSIYKGKADTNDFQYCSAKADNAEEPRTIQFQVLSSEEKAKDENKDNDCKVSFDDVTNVCKYNIRIYPNMSVATTPIPIYGHQGESLRIGNLTQKIDRYFIENKQDVGIEWQYFAHRTGLMRYYPAVEWIKPKVSSRNYRKPLGYDPRLESWYLQSLTVRKDILILLDTGGDFMRSV